MNNPHKNIVITGASSGIGYQVALSCCQKGHHVYALARSIHKLKQLKKESKKLKGTISIIQFDLSTYDISILEKEFREISNVDILINNAGILLNKEFLKIKEEEIYHVMNVNFVSVIKLIQFFHPFLIKSKNPHILNISSVGGVTGSVKFPGLSIYSSSKGALSILTECLAQDFKEDSIKVNCLALGAVDTQMLQQAFPEFNADVSAKKMGKYITSFALNANDVVNGQTQVLSMTNP